MFVVHSDMTIYATRGDVVYFPVEKKVGDAKYLFQAGDIVRIKICEKKNYSKVFLLKDFVVEESTTSVNIFLSKWEMKFGPIIHKATDYWYEVELNPDTYPDTFIGHNENGPAIFKLFPEAKDVVEGEIPDPEENAAVSRMVVHFVNEYLGDKAETIIQEILKEEHLETIVNGLIKEEHIETIVREIINDGTIETIVQEIVKTENVGTIVQEIVKTENVETIVQEIVKPGNVETIVQEIIRPGNVETIVKEILQPEHTETIVQEIIKEENIGTIVQEIIKEENIETIIQEITKPEHIQTIVEQVKEEVPGQLTVTVDWRTDTASHSASEINAHIAKGGSVVLAKNNFQDNDNNVFYQPIYLRTPTKVYFHAFDMAEDTIWQTVYSIDDNKAFNEDTITFEGGGSGSGSGGEVSQIDFSNFENGSFTETVDGEVITHPVTFDEQGRPVTIDDAVIVWGNA